DKPSRAAVMASTTSCIGPSVRSISIWPASVSLSPRALRSMSRTPSCSSRSAMRRDRVALDLPLARLAFPSPPFVATSAKSVNAFRSTCSEVETACLDFRIFVLPMQRPIFSSSQLRYEQTEMTTTQRAVLIRAYGGVAAAEVAEIARPAAGQGQVLVRVRAAGVNGIDWKFREGYVRDAFPLQLPAVLGIELAGTVEAVGPGASRFRVGDRVMGPLGGLGAYADFVAVDEANLVRTPQGLDDVHAAGVPVAAVAAWHSLHHAG